MNKKLYKLMNWADIEEIIYSECDHPQDLLGPHPATGGTLVQAYFPGAKAVSVKWLSSDPLIGDSVTQMEMADEDGYFAVILPEKKIFNYTYSVTYETVGNKKTIKKETVEVGDPYRHSQIISKADIDLFCSGEMTDAYKRFGAKPMKHSGENGVLFSVWAPNAMRVSVVGEFNNWDGRIYQMKRIEGGFFELFIPGNLVGKKFQYELKLKGDIILKRNDPYSVLSVDGISVISDTDNFKWSDEDYTKTLKKKPDSLLVYELSDKVFSCDENKFVKDTAKFIKHIKSQGYKYIQINQQKYDDNLCSISNLYAINSNYISASCLKYLINQCHINDIGVILSWNASGFGRAEGAMERFDGTALFEHQNPMQGVSANGQNMLYQYGKSEVISFLISNGMYWINEFHADGICLSSVAQMLYLDYGKYNGQWIPNIYGDNENIEAVGFIKKFINIVNKISKPIITIAEDSSTHAGMTTLQSSDGMGFDFKWNEGYMKDFIDYMSQDPLYRNVLHNKLVDEYVYSFAENFIIPMSAKLISDSAELINRFPGNDEMKNAALRTSVAYQYMHPGNMLVTESIDALQTKLCRELNNIFENEAAIGKNNTDSAGFEWLSNMKADGCYISYVRKTDDPEEMMLAVINFAGIDQTITTGVPYEGKYEEMLNTDDKLFGGTGIVNSEIIRAEAIQADGRPQTITVKLAAQSMTIMKFIPYTEEELAIVIEERIRNYTPVKKTKSNKSNKSNKTK